MIINGRAAFLMPLFHCIAVPTDLKLYAFGLERPGVAAELLSFSRASALEGGLNQDGGLSKVSALRFGGGKSSSSITPSSFAGLTTKTAC